MIDGIINIMELGLTMEFNYGLWYIYIPSSINSLTMLYGRYTVSIVNGI